MRKVLLYIEVMLILAISIISIVYVVRKKDQGKDIKLTEEKLVVYAARSDNLLDATIPLFEEKYGIEVELVTGESGELFTRIREESDDPTADIIMGATYSSMDSNRDLFQEYISVNDKYLLDSYKNKTGLTTSYILEGSCFIVNKSLLQDVRVEGFQDLLNPRLKGKIIAANPISSSFAFSQLTNTLLSMGGYESEEAWDYVTKLIENMGEIASSSEKVYTSVASGNNVIGLTYESPCITLISDSADVDIIYPKEGSVFLPTMAAITKTSNNVEYAKHFIDFITSKDMQNIYADILLRRSVHRDVIEGEYLVPIHQIHVIEEDMEYVKQHKLEILSQYSVIVDQIMGEE